jgi:hypothetical protein
MKKPAKKRIAKRYGAAAEPKAIPTELLAAIDLAAKAQALVNLLMLKHEAGQR